MMKSRAPYYKKIKRRQRAALRARPRLFKKHLLVERERKKKALKRRQEAIKKLECFTEKFGSRLQQQKNGFIRNLLAQERKHEIVLKRFKPIYGKNVRSD